MGTSYAIIMRSIFAKHNYDDTNARFCHTITTGQGVKLNEKEEIERWRRKEDSKTMEKPDDSE